MSVRGGRRVEIKGVPQAGWAPRLVHGEAIAAGEPAASCATSCTAAGFATPESIGVESAGRDGARSPRPRRRSCASRAWERFVARREPARRASSWARGQVPRPRRSGCRASRGTLGWPTQPGLHLRARAGGPHPRHRRPRPARRSCSTARSGPTTTGRCRSCARCARTCGCGPEDGIVLVWGPERRHADRGRRDPAALRRRDQRHPERDAPAVRGRHDRLRADPARARPHVPGHRQPADARHARAGRAAAARRCAERPWEREARYAAAGVPTTTVHFLDPARAAPRSSTASSAEAGAELRMAAFFFGERLKGLRRDGRRRWTRSPTTRWVRAVRRRLARGRSSGEAWDAIVRAMAGAPGRAVAALARRRSASTATPAGWRRARRRGRSAGATREAYDGRPRTGCCRFSTGLAMRRASRPGAGARGRRRPSAAEVARDEHAGRSPRRATRAARAPRSRRWGVRVWSDVAGRRTTPAAVFEGVILPRSETLDDLHVVIKLKNGYNVGLHVGPRRGRSTEVGYKEAVYKIPEKEFPSPAGPAERHAARHRRHDRLAARLPHRRRDPGLHARRALRRGARARRHRNLTTKKLFGVFSENMAKRAVHRAGRGDRRGDRERRRRHRDRPRHRHDGPHRGDPLVHGAGHAGADRDGRLAALQRPAVVRRRAQPDPRGARRRPTATSPRCMICMFGPTSDQLRPAAPRHALPQDAQLLPQHLPHHRRHPAGDGQPRRLHLPPRATTGGATRRGRSRSTPSTTTARRSSTTTRA